MPGSEGQACVWVHESGTCARARAERKWKVRSAWGGQWHGNTLAKTRLSHWQGQKRLSYGRQKGESAQS